MYRSKVLTVYKAGRGMDFWLAAYFNSKETFFHKAYKVSGPS